MFSAIRRSARRFLTFAICWDALSVARQFWFTVLYEFVAREVSCGLHGVGLCSRCVTVAERPFHSFARTSMGNAGRPLRFVLFVMRLDLVSACVQHAF